MIKHCCQDNSHIQLQERLRNSPVPNDVWDEQRKDRAGKSQLGRATEKLFDWKFEVESLGKKDSAALISPYLSARFGYAVFKGDITIFISLA